jgi:hypothetical protein
MEILVDSSKKNNLKFILNQYKYNGSHLRRFTKFQKEIGYYQYHTKYVINIIYDAVSVGIFEIMTNVYIKENISYNINIINNIMILNFCMFLDRISTFDDNPNTDSISWNNKRINKWMRKSDEILGLLFYSIHWNISK